MNINRIDIHGFGVWSGLKLDGLSDHLNVFYGRNEAGKTTLMQFVRSVLYGFSPERQGRYLPPVHGGRAGGALHIDTNQGSFEISRHHDVEHATVDGDLRVLADDGTLHSDHLLRTLWCGIDEPIYNHVFAIGLREIQELGTLGDTAAADMLFKLTTGLDRVSLVDVLRELATSRDRLLSDDSRPSQIVLLLGERARLQKELDSLGDLTRQYARLSAERDRLQIELSRNDARLTELEQASRLLDVAVTVRDRWHQRTDLGAQLTALQDAPRLPARALERLERITGRLARLEKNLTDSRRERKLLRAEATKLTAHKSLWRQAPRIEALIEQRTWAAGLETQINSARAELAGLETQWSTANGASGLGDLSHEKTPLLNRAAMSRLKPTAKALRETRQHWHATRKQLVQARETADALDRQIRTALAGRNEQQLTPALERAGTLVANLRRRIQLDERLEQMQQNRTELTERSHGLLDRQLLPFWVLASLGGVFVFGVVLLLASMFLPSIGAAGWTLAVLGLLGAGAAFGGKYLMEQSATQQWQSCQKQLTVLDSQITQSKQERDALDAQLPRGGGPLLVRLGAAEKDLATLEELLDVDARRQVALQTAETIRVQAELARDEGRVALRRWKQVLTVAGLPTKLSPQQVRHLVDRRGALDELWRRVERTRQDVQQRERELDTFAARVRQLAAEANLPLAGMYVTEHLQQLEQVLAEQATRDAQREALHARYRQLRRAERQETRELKRWSRRRKRLLRVAGTKNETEFRRRALQSARADWLRQQFETLSAEIAAALGNIGTEEELRQHVEHVEPARLEEYARDVAARRREVQQQLQTLAEQRGQLAQQMRNLAEDRRPGITRLELDMVEQRLAEARERWQVLAVTHRLLTALRKTYEADHQPETLKEASDYLVKLTEGHYTRVWTPLDEDVLRVDDAEGNSLPVEVLSRGTREQLFLSLRLALVSAYGRRGVQLPMVLDDVLVNFDAQRAKAAAKVLRDFAAQGYQLLVFTCHEHIAEVFQALKAPTRQLPSNAEVHAKSAMHAKNTVAITAKPAAVAEMEEEADEPTPTPRKRTRKSRKKAEPFAGTVWHEPVEEEPTPSPIAADDDEEDEEDLLEEVAEVEDTDEDDDLVGLEDLDDADEDEDEELDGEYEDPDDNFEDDELEEDELDEDAEAA